MIKIASFIFFLLNFTDCASNIETIESLREALQSSKTATIAFYSRANLVSTSALFKGINFSYEIISNQSAILEGVHKGKFLAGCVAEDYDENINVNVIKTGILSGHAIFTLPDQTNEYPHGASIEQSRKDFRNAINLAITKVQSQGLDFDLAKKFNKPIKDLKTCKLNNPEEFPIPNSVNATGILKDILKNRFLLVGSYGDEDTTLDTDENNQEFPFHSAYLSAILSEFAKLSGPDKLAYGPVQIKRVFSKSSTPNLLRGRIHMTEPYFLIDNVYSGSKETCNTDQDCVLSDAPNGRESCKNSTCVAHSRPISEFFKMSCLTYGTESLFLTKKTSTKSKSQNKNISGGIIAVLVILSVTVVCSVLIVSFMIWRERIGTPLFA
jgi:hypothetical protein